MQLRDFQQTVQTGIETAWAIGHRNVIGVLPTGGGKTALFSSIISKTPGIRVVSAHRGELVSQIALSLARWGVPHNIIAAPSTIRDCVIMQQEELRRSFYSARAEVQVASVDTLINKSFPWFPHVTLNVTDEAHHVLRENKWGKACSLFPNARNLGVTASPIRADGKGLGAHADGIFTHMVVGPTMGELIQMGWLTEYDVYSFKPGDLDFSQVETGSTGDYKMPQLRKATHASTQLVGDVVQTYLRYAAGKRGITFAVDIEQARELHAAYEAAGVRCAIVTGNTPDAQRAAMLRKFRSGDIHQLINVDLFGEGFDVPGVEVVSMARKTASYSLFSQQLGREMRPVFPSGFDPNAATDEQRRAAIASSSKPRGILLDHVGNYMYHAMTMGLPEDPKPWTLDAREKRSSSTTAGIKLRPCEGCSKPYEAFRKSCPYCGHTPAPGERGRPEQVDGDLELIDRTLLAEMLREAGRVVAEVRVPQHLVGTPAGGAILKNHHARYTAQIDLRQAIAQWGGWEVHKGLSVAEAQRKFYHQFGVDVLTAQTYGAKEAEQLRGRIEERMGV